MHISGYSTRCQRRFSLYVCMFWQDVCEVVMYLFTIKQDFFLCPRCFLFFFWLGSHGLAVTLYSTRTYTCMCTLILPDFHSVSVFCFPAPFLDEMLFRFCSSLTAHIIFLAVAFDCEMSTAFTLDIFFLPSGSQLHVHPKTLLHFTLHVSLVFFSLFPPGRLSTAFLSVLSHNLSNIRIKNNKCVLYVSQLCYIFRSFLFLQ